MDPVGFMPAPRGIGVPAAIFPLREMLREKDRLIKELDRELDRAHDYITSLLAELNRVE